MPEIWIAIPWAAKALVPSQPIITAVAENKPLSANIVIPTGNPNLKTSLKASISNRQILLKIRYEEYSSLNKQKYKRINIERIVVTKVAIAAPVKPNSGIPKLPKIKV